MINFAVDDPDAFLTNLKAKAVPILKRDDSDLNDAFAWIVDPDGTKFELYQPKEKSSAPRVTRIGRNLRRKPLKGGWKYAPSRVHRPHGLRDSA